MTLKRERYECWEDGESSAFFNSSNESARRSLSRRARRLWTLHAHHPDEAWQLMYERRGWGRASTWHDGRVRDRATKLAPHLTPGGRPRRGARPEAEALVERVHSNGLLWLVPYPDALRLRMLAEVLRESQRLGRACDLLSARREPAGALAAWVRSHPSRADLTREAAASLGVSARTLAARRAAPLLERFAVGACVRAFLEETASLDRE